MNPLYQTMMNDKHPRLRDALVMRLAHPKADGPFQAFAFRAAVQDGVAPMRVVTMLVEELRRAVLMQALFGRESRAVIDGHSVYTAAGFRESTGRGFHYGDRIEVEWSQEARLETKDHVIEYPDGSTSRVPMVVVSAAVRFRALPSDVVTARLTGTVPA